MHSYLLIDFLNQCKQWGSVSVHTSPIDFIRYCATSHCTYKEQYTVECTVLLATCMETFVLSVHHTLKFTCYSLCPKKMTPLDTSIRKKSGILSKRHIILVELNESYKCMNNIKCGRKSLYVHNRVFRQKNHRTSIVKRITRHCGHP
jgi:hypothetical protein